MVGVQSGVRLTPSWGLYGYLSKNRSATEGGAGVRWMW